MSSRRGCPPDAKHVDARDVLAAGTQTVQANGTLRVPFSEAQKVPLFLDTGPGAFDGKEVLFTDQIVDNLSVTAVVQVNAGVISTVQFLGDGGSIQTAQAITTAVTSTRPLGDLLLSSSFGIRDVTAPSIFGNIDTNGPIFGTIQTTVGDLGRAITNSSGTIIGTTFINTNQGITGRIISRGNLVSHISSQREFSGVIAAQGDIGVAYVNAGGQLVRFGGLLSNGQLSGSIVALGNILGDIEAKNGVDGRIAAKGRVIPGLSSSRIGILGNFNISGNLEVGSAIVSGGVIGDAAGGTFLDVGQRPGHPRRQGRYQRSPRQHPAGRHLRECHRRQRRRHRRPLHPLGRRAPRFRSRGPGPCRPESHPRGFSGAPCRSRRYADWPHSLRLMAGNAAESDFRGRTSEAPVVAPVAPPRGAS